MKRVALYVRVSHEEQVKHGISVDAQIEALTQFAQDNNYKVVDIYNDAGISARKAYTKRPELLRMIKDCQQDRIDLILICKLDRFFRSVPDYYAVMSQIGNVPWKAIHEDYETETANGVFKVNIMLSVAQSEADRTGERIKKVFEYKRLKGEVVSGATAHGYVIENKKWIKDKTQCDAINTFYENYLSTFKFLDSYNLAVAKGLTCSYRAALSFINNPFYYGSAPYITEGYISKEDFDLIQKNKASFPKVNKYDYIFRGVCKCGLCGGYLSGRSTVYKTKKGEKRVALYICSKHSHGYGCKGSTISEKALTDFLFREFDKQLNNYNISIKIAQKSSNSKDISSLNAKLKRLRNLYELDDISFEEYKAKRDSIMTQLSKLENVPKSKVISVPENWQEIYNELDISHKNAFWVRTIDYIEVTGRNCKNPTIFF